MTQQHINFKRERRFGDKINATFAFLSQNLKPLAKSALYVAGPFALLTTLVMQVYQQRAFSGMADTVSGSNPAAAAAWLTSSGWFAYIALIYLVIFVMAALTIAIAQRHIKAYVETGDASIEPGYLWKTIWRDFFSALGTTIGISLLLGLLFGFMMVPFGLLIAAIPSPFTVLIMLLGLFVGGLMLSSVMLLIYPILNFERTNFFDAIGRAFTLNSGKWWSSAGLVFVVFAIQFAILIALSIPIYIITFMRGFHLDNPAEMMAQATEFSWFTIFSALSSVIYSIGFTLIGSILFIALSFQYFNLRERREASGLLERMQSFGEAPIVHEEEERY